MSAKIITGFYVEKITTSSNPGLTDERQLALMNSLKKGDLAEGQELFETVPAKAKAIEFSVSQESTSDMATQAPSSENATKEFIRADIQDNIAGDEMTTVTGNIGFEPGYTAAYTGTSIFRKNKMGNKAVLITGDVGGKGAEQLMQKLFDE